MAFTSKDEVHQRNHILKGHIELIRENGRLTKTFYDMTQKFGGGGFISQAVEYNWTQERYKDTFYFPRRIFKDVNRYVERLELGKVYHAVAIRELIVHVYLKQSTQQSEMFLQNSNNAERIRDALKNIGDGTDTEDAAWKEIRKEILS